MQVHKDFEQLFLDKEGKELEGNNRSNLWILIGMLSLTFLAIAFANGSLDYLNKKMSNPFIKWITISVPATSAGKVYEYKEYLNQPDLKQTYGYDTISSYRNFFMTFRYRNSEDTDAGSGRTIETSNPLLEEILSSKNGFAGSTFRNREDVGLIVTKDFLKEFGYATNEVFVFMEMTQGHFDEMDQRYVIDDKRAVPIPVRAVVDNLPGSNKIAFTPYFYKQRVSYHQQNKSGNPFNPLAHEAEINTNQLIYYLNSTDKEEIKLFIGTVKNFFEEHQLYKNWGANVFEVPNDYMNNGVNIQITFMDAPEDIKVLDKIHKELDESNYLADFKVNGNRAMKYVRFYEYDLRNFEGDIKADYLSINLNSLDKIRDLRKYILKTHELEIDISKVEALENYNFVTRLTIIISAVLILFSVISICLFVANLLRTHLNKIKMNLGTFKAFGLDNENLQKIYLYMILRMVLLAKMISFIGVVLAGYIGVGRGILWLLGGKLEAGEYYFQPLSWSMLFSIGLILGFIYWIVQRTSHQILQKTPGDLIYNRD